MKPASVPAFAGALLAAALLGAVAALWTWTRPGDPALYPAPPGPAAVTVHLLDNGFHTDLLVPRAALAARGGALGGAARGLAPGGWVRVGWGDARFYVEQGPVAERLADGARAFFLPGNASVVMLDPEAGDPARYAPAARRTLRLSPAGFDRLADRIEASLDTPGGVARLAAARPNDDARFFASRETFSVLHLCNHWTARVLNAAGIAVRPARSITSGEVMRAAERAVTLDTQAVRD